MGKHFPKEILDKINNLYNQGFCDREVGERLNVSGNAVSTWRRRNNLSPNKWRQGYEIRECKQCKKSFEILKSRLRNKTSRRGIFCSRECYFLFLDINKKHDIRKICKNCNNVFLTKKESRKFCSKHCSGSYQMRDCVRGEKASNWQGGKIERNCLACGKSFKVWRFRAEEGYGWFCSFDCYIKNRVTALPSGPEKIFMNICKIEKLPFKYTGDKQCWVGRKNPDFIHTDKNKKVCIEIFSSYYHNPLRKKIKYNRTYNGTKEHYQKNGWSCIIFWDYEIEKNKEKVLEKVMEVC